MEFKVGDLVQLKSGGYQMEIVAIDRRKASCTWFDKNDCLCQRFFDLDALDLVKKGQLI